MSDQNVGDDGQTASDAPEPAAIANGDLVHYEATSPYTGDIEHGFALVVGTGEVTAEDGSTSPGYDLVPVSRLGYLVGADGVTQV